MFEKLLNKYIILTCLFYGDNNILISGEALGTFHNERN